MTAVTQVTAMAAWTAPWIEGDTTAAGLTAALVCGAGFGAALERAGLGSAKKLVGQFHGTDLTVFKVMFSAILVAMLGAFWLGWLGVLDLARVAIPETWLAPQAAGGVVFGAGMAIAGLCPGTSCVAAASGRGDGLAVLLGMLGGVLATGLGFAPLAGFYESTARGPLTLPAWLGVPEGVVVLAVVAIAFAGFAFAGWFERRASGLADDARDGLPPRCDRASERRGEPARDGLPPRGDRAAVHHDARTRESLP